jgi:hypothetical protein
MSVLQAMHLFVYADFWLWLILELLVVVLFIVAAYLLPKRSPRSTYDAPEINVGNLFNFAFRWNQTYQRASIYEEHDSTLHQT